MYVMKSPHPVNRPLAWTLQPSRLRCWSRAFSSKGFKKVSRAGLWEFVKDMTKLGYNVVPIVENDK